MCLSECNISVLALKKLGERNAFIVEKFTNDDGKMSIGEHTLQRKKERKKERKRKKLRKKERMKHNKTCQGSTKPSFLTALQA